MGLMVMYKVVLGLGINGDVLGWTNGFNGDVLGWTRI